MSVNATGDAGTHPRQRLISRGRSVFISPTFVKIVTKLPAELMRTLQPLFVVQARLGEHRESQRERESDSPYFA